MIKKLIVLIILSTLIISTLSANGVVLQKQRELKACEICFWDEISDYNYNEKYPTMVESSDFLEFTQKGKPEIIDTPNNFSWADLNGENWLTPVKKQLCGDCWDFAALGTLESIIKIRENCSEFNPDLSEQYILSCLSGAGSCHGGSSYLAFERIMDTSERGNFCNGVTLENCFPYQASDEIPCEEKCDNWKENLVPILDFGQWQPSKGDQGINEIKTFIVQNGPVVAHIFATRFFKYWGSIHHNPDDYFPYTGPKILFNHVVMLVGWKDDPNVREGGYWICKNSWGTDWGYNGFFNIAYDALNIDNANMVWVDYNPDSFDWNPVANAGGNRIGKTDEKIVFNGSDSVDPDSYIKKYYWDFGDGNKSKSEVVSHSYQKEGIYNVALMVTDSNGNNNTDRIFVWVDKEANPPDIPKVDGPRFILPKKEYTFTISTTDRDGDNVYYLVDFGGYFDEKEWIGPYESGEKINISKSWDFFEKHVVNVKAKDMYGLVSDWNNSTVKKTKLRQSLMVSEILNFLLKT